MADTTQKKSISIRWNSEMDINTYPICISQYNSMNVTENRELHISFSGTDDRIFIDDRIYIEPSLIQTYNNSDNKQLGIFIQTFIGGSMDMNVGFGLGHNVFAYHPGYSHGHARLEGANGWGNESMGFNPESDVLYKFEIFITTDSMIYLSVIDPNNESNKYQKQWQYTGSLFVVDKQNTILEKKTFSLRTHCCQPKWKARFGDIDMNIAERNKLNSKIDIIDNGNEIVSDEKTDDSTRKEQKPQNIGLSENDEKTIELMRKEIDEMRDEMKNEINSLKQEIMSLKDIILTNNKNTNNNSYYNNINNSDTKEISEFLEKKVQLPQYVYAFVDAGFTDIQSVACVTNEDLEKLGCKMAHRHKILKALFKEWKK